MKKLAKVLIILLVILAIGGLGLTMYIGDQIVKSTENLVSREDTLINEGKFLKNTGLALSIGEKLLTIESYKLPAKEEGKEIPVDYISIDGKEDKNSVILVHPLGGTRKTNYVYAPIFLERGYNIYTYDQRNSGENSQAANTGGIKESEDLLTVIKDVRSRIGEDKKLVILSASYGGATTALALGKDESGVDLAILDSPMSDQKYMIEEELKKVAKENNIPAAYMLFAGDIMTRIEKGYGYSDFDSSKYISKTTVPVVVLKTSGDTVLPETMADDLYKAVSHDKKDLIVLENSKHAEKILEDPIAYREIIVDVMDKYLK